MVNRLAAASPARVRALLHHLKKKHGTFMAVSRTVGASRSAAAYWAKKGAVSEKYWKALNLLANSHSPVAPAASATKETSKAPDQMTEVLRIFLRMAPAQRQHCCDLLLELLEV